MSFETNVKNDFTYFLGWWFNLVNKINCNNRKLVEGFKNSKLLLILLSWTIGIGCLSLRLVVILRNFQRWGRSATHPSFWGLPGGHLLVAFTSFVIFGNILLPIRSVCSVNFFHLLLLNYIMSWISHLSLIYWLDILSWNVVPTWT